MSREWARRGLADLLGGASVVGYSERQLLERFVISRDESAFAAIVARHGPMVVHVCRSVLTNSADVDDAFQATFLVLVRKAGSLRDVDQLSPWLHGVARRVALRARSDAAQRSDRESPGVPVEAVAADLSLRSAESRELAFLIHAELGRLSLAERSAILLCDLEGLSHQEAADQLGWPLGTVKSRVNRGRERLRTRLIRRGVTLPSGVLASSWLIQSTASALVSPGLAAATTRASIAWGAGRALSTSLISVSVLSLTQGVSRTMIFTKLKAGAVALAVASSVVAVPSLVAYQNPDSGHPEGPVAGRLETRAEIVAKSETNTAEGPTDLNGVRLKLAQTAVESMAITDPQGMDIYNDFRFGWLQHLTDAELDQASTHDQRVKVMEASIARLNKLGDERAKAISAQIGPLSASAEAKDDSDRLEQAWKRLQPVADEINSAKKRLAAIQNEASPPSSPQSKGVVAASAGGFGMGMGGSMAGGMAGGMGGGAVSPGRQGQSTETLEELERRTVIATELRRRLMKSMPVDDYKNRAVLQKLEERVSMNFPHDTPLSDVLQYIRAATQDEPLFPKGIPIYVDPLGLQDADKTIASTIAIDLEGIPLRTTLNLALKQIELTYVVENGLLVIEHLDASSSRSLPESTRPAKGRTGPGGFQ